jgi:hypothetical protein
VRAPPARPPATLPFGRLFLGCGGVPAEQFLGNILGAGHPAVFDQVEDAQSGGE